MSIAATAPPPVPAAIFAAAPDYQTRLAMLTGAALEGGYGPTYGAGDAGQSLGPFQINLPSHPGVTPAQATDPAFATSYMLPSYQAAEQQVPASLFTQNPEQWAEEVAATAERPFAGSGPQNLAYFTQGRNVDAAYQSALGALNGTSPQAGMGGGGAGMSPAAGAATLTAFGGPLNPANWPQEAAGVIKAVTAPLKAYLEDAALVVIGLVLLVVGLVVLAHAGVDAGSSSRNSPSAPTSSPAPSSGPEAASGEEGATAAVAAA